MRPWYAHDFIKDMLQLMICDSESIVRMVQENDICKHLYEEAHKDMDFEVRVDVICDLGQALHGFNKSSKPLARHHFAYEALFFVTIRIGRVR